MLFIAFTLYLILFLSLTFAFGLNSVRIAWKTSSNPKIFTLLFPLLINFLLAHTLFRSINPLFSTLLPCLITYFGFKRLQKIRIFGLTGGICTGKNTLLKLLNKHLKHVQYVDTYDIIRFLIQKDLPCYKQILRELGNRSNQFLNKKNDEIILPKLCNQMQRNKKLQKLVQKQLKNKMFWRVIWQIIKNVVNKKNVMVINTPNQFQCNWLNYVSYPVVFVNCPLNIQLARVCQKFKCDEAEAIKIIQNGVPVKQLKRNCQIQISSTGTQQMLLSEFLTQVKPYMSSNPNKMEKNK